MRKIKVYIASSYTNGWMPDNVRRQLEAKHILLDYGFIPFAPLETHFAEIYRHRPEHDWFQWDLEWLSVCDIIVRIRAFDSEGNQIISNGSDQEMDFARQKGITVYDFNDLTELRDWAKEMNLKNLTTI
jgi:nucleoside 2-deoxyribosyltransferase